MNIVCSIIPPTSPKIAFRESLREANFVLTEISGNLKEFAGECNVGILYSSSLVGAVTSAVTGFRTGSGQKRGFRRKQEQLKQATENVLASSAALWASSAPRRGARAAMRPGEVNLG